MTEHLFNYCAKTQLVWDKIVELTGSSVHGLTLITQVLGWTILTIVLTISWLL